MIDLLGRVGRKRAPDTSTEAIADLREVAAIAVEHGGDLGLRFANKVELVLAPGSELSFEAAFGLLGNWRTRARVKAQAVILRRIADRHFRTLAAGRSPGRCTWPAGGTRCAHGRATAKQIVGRTV